jgi:hypothetical protein
MDFTLSQQQYESLVALARAGATTTEKTRRLSEFLKQIETASGITRDFVWVQWQEMDQPLPPSVRFPETWPPDMRWYIELVTRLVSRADVDQVLATRASKPTNVLCTRDPAAVLGWTPIDNFFLQ